MRLGLGKRILRLFDPHGERERMHMREWRCIAEANAEDLHRTVRMNREKLAEMVKKEAERRGKVNGEAH